MTNRGTVRGVILVTGATSNVGRRVVSQLLRTSTAVRALTCGLESAGLPGDAACGGLSVPDTCPNGGEVACVDGDLQQQAGTIASRIVAELVA